MKSFRDPVHNLIAFGPEDRLLVELINTKEVQRLRRIRQLGLSNIAYPGAEHSRFVHSLGVLHLMRRCMDGPARLSITGQEAEIHHYRHLAMAAALLHDVGHGPFSHALEAITGDRHELWTTALIRSPKTEIHQVLESVETGFSEHVASVVEKDFAPSRAIVKLLSSQMDMDRADYLLRDAMMTGAGYGSFDVEWLLHVMRIGEVDGDLEVGLDLAKGQSIAEDYIMCRYYMYLHVYFHRTTRAAEVLVEKLLRRAQAMRAYLPGFDALTRLLDGGLQAKDPESLDAYLELDDAMLWTATHFWAKHSDPVLVDLASRLLHRKIFRGIDVQDEAHAKRLLAKLRERAAALGMPEEYYVTYDTAASHAYKDSYVAPTGPATRPDGATSRLASENIFMFDDHGRAHELSQVSFIAAAVRDKRVSVQRILCPEEWVDDDWDS